jgi:FOG: PKD repeat
LKPQAANKKKHSGHPKEVLFLFVFLFLNSFQLLSQVTYLEDFNQPGLPTGSGYWYTTLKINPQQITSQVFPGDGFAYLTIDQDVSNDLGTNPFQIIGYGKVAPGQRIEVKMKGAVVEGLVGFLFTYNELETFNEIDIELVADDEQTTPSPHPITGSSGWTDARFNTWENANTSTDLPSSIAKKRVVDVLGNDKTLIDDAFHTYTIDWGVHRIDYYIDHVLQQSHKTNIATGSSEVIIGFRDLPWAGPFSSSDATSHTLVIDYLKLEPFDENKPTSYFATDQRHATPNKTISFYSQTPIANSYNWSFPGGTPSSSTLKNPQITYSSTGKYDISLTTSNTYGSTTHTEAQYISIDTETDVSDQRSTSTMDIFPNPTSGKVEIKGKSEELDGLKVFDVLGQEINGYPVSSGSESMVIDLSRLSAGAYLIKGKTTTHLVLKK